MCFHILNCAKMIENNNSLVPEQIMASATLQTIQAKVRRLTRSPSLSQLSQEQLNDYINTFILYDFPSNIRLFSLRKTLTFYTQPGVDVYSTNTTVPTDPLYNFRNEYVAVHPPIFLAGIQGFYTQWRDIFYGYYPQTNTISQTQLFGNGEQGPFTGLIIEPPPPTSNGASPYPFILQNNVNFNCVNTSGYSMVLVDTPISNTMGNLSIANTPPTSTVDVDPNNNINYVTGAFTLTFNADTQPLAPIWFEGILYQPGKPLAMLYYNDEFTIRPVPDKTYSVQIEVDVRPTQLINQTDVPYLEQWWTYIAYGAARRIFQDRMDLESVAMIDPEFRLQERLVLRTTLTQQANERTTTIYTQGKNYGFGWFGSGGWPYQNVAIVIQLEKYIRK